jgi:TldD protein
VPGSPSTLRLERGAIVVATLEGERAVQVSTAELERGRVVDGDTTRHFTGPGPAALNASRLPAVAPPVAPAAVVEALAAFGGRLGASAQLTYWCLSSIRSVVRGRERASRRSVAVWALTGEASLAGGRPVPIGWSGRGDGLRQLGDEKATAELRRRIEAVAKARAVQSGRAGLVLLPAASAVVLHEALGHFAEAWPGIDLRHRVGARVASELLSLTDDSLSPDAPAAYSVDDDGVLALGPTEIVRHGVLVGQLHSLATARAAGVAPTANGRTESGWAEALPRMSNLVCEPGTAHDGELVQSLWRGLLVHALADGWSVGDAVGARIVLAEEIVRGRRTRRFLSGGRIRWRRSALLRVAEVGRRAVFSANAMCGKHGQLLCDVGTAAPALRLAPVPVEA